jgi:hypothetical protein
MIMPRISRLLTGFAGGAFVMAAPTYIAEISEPRFDVYFLLN